VDDHHVGDLVRDGLADARPEEALEESELAACRRSPGGIALDPPRILFTAAVKVVESALYIFVK
jgi:hypothetical protein